MIGTIVNTCTIVVGTLIGVALHKGIKEKYKYVLYDALGLACFAIGFFYVDGRGPLYGLTFVGAAAVLYRSPGQMLKSLSLGFLLAVFTDINLIEEEEFKKLRGLDYVTVNCVKKAPHYSHFSLDEALAFFERVGAKESYITHLSHMLPRHASLSQELAALPFHLQPAYDGLTVEF